MACSACLLIANVCSERLGVCLCYQWQAESLWRLGTHDSRALRNTCHLAICHLIDSVGGRDSHRYCLMLLQCLAYTSNNILAYEGASGVVEEEVDYWCRV